MPIVLNKFGIIVISAATVCHGVPCPNISCGGGGGGERELHSMFSSALSITINCHIGAPIVVCANF